MRTDIDDIDPDGKEGDDAGLQLTECPQCGADLTDPAQCPGGWHICDAGPEGDDNLPV